MSRYLVPWDSSKGDGGWAAVAEIPWVLLENLKFGARLLYLTWREGEEDLYSQPVIAERGGSAALVVDDKSGKFRMVQLWRPYTKDVDRYRETFPDVDPENLGSLMWETPRGMAKLAESPSDTAVREAEEELQAKVIASQPLGRGVSNSTYFPQPTEFFLITIDLNQEPEHLPDDLDGVTGSQWFSLEDYRRAGDSGIAIDDTTGHMIALAIIKYPGLLK